MLRSRGNRQQRPSESSNERNNSGGASYGGYPGGGGMMGVASGADDDYSYSGGYGNNRSGYKKSYNNNNNTGGNNKNVWDRKAMGSTIKGGPKGSNNGSSAGLILLAATFIMTCFMGGMTLHYRKANDRMEHELMIVRRKMKMGGGRGGGHLHHRPHHDDDDDDDDSVQNNNANDNNNDNTLTPRNPKEHELMIELAKLSSQRQDLQAEKHTWEARTKSLEHEITAYESQINHLTNGEIKSYQTQLSTISQGLQNEQLKATNYKKAFVEMHSSSGKMLTPRAGPGHTLTQRKEIENMDSLDDYEDYVQRREDALWDKIDLLVDKLGKESRREAIEWFGPGPHRVEMTISYPKYDPDKEPADWPIARGVFLLEMAPLDIMPIAVNLFLQQVHHKLWNNCSFVINAMHILQAGPHRYTEGGQYDANLDELISKFENARLDKMPFQEYHAEFPHEQWTVGFAGRPGGPDFYINKIDNSVNHGPGGQTHHDLHEEADPAFAKLVSGMEIIKDLNRIPVDYDKGALLLHPVVILDSKVIASNCEEGCWRE